jgi:hypothetical protein
MECFRGLVILTTRREVAQTEGCPNGGDHTPGRDHVHVQPNSSSMSLRIENMLVAFDWPRKYLLLVVWPNRLMKLYDKQTK